MPTLAITNFNIVLSVLGGFISLFGLVSYLLKENFYLSEALISLFAGVIVSPSAGNLIRPLEYTSGNAASVDLVTLYFSRLVLGVQLVLAGVQLPSRYLAHEWKPLSLLLGPIMVAMWLTTSLLVWALVPGIAGGGFLYALAVGACVTPTDPVLSNVIVKGRFADHNVPKELQRIIIAESGANDGLGYPFLFFALYLIKYGGREAMGMWFGETWGYTILLSVVYGAAVGWIAKELLHWAEERKFVDRESFLVFAISLALFIVGTCGMIGSDDILACFIAGNVFTWDDWFRLETLDDSLQPTVDMLLNVSVFMWFGVVCPWSSFVNNDVVQIYRLVPLGLLVLLLRRLPWVFAIHAYVPQIEEVRQAIFVGFFGPIGVSAIFYLYIALEFLDTWDVGARDQEEIHNLGETIRVVVWFLAVCSIVVHGLSIPLGKLGFYLPRTLSRQTTSANDEDGAPPFTSSRVNLVGVRGAFRRSRTGTGSPGHTPAASTSTEGTVLRIGGTVILGETADQRPDPAEIHRAAGVAGASSTSGPPGRTIRFPDELPPTTFP
ncbi:Sodium/hydrogen exchanger family-domain-containing protein [Podospora aff. communis PSN243]|uniref:Sodium/hydrogen exchanger family-domain-containing protein n=1 Tax=Podospora aff. communis PSN243 TaxID=3040156 RepID=A0AAV9H4Q4_9PEZI|nr:Sodium/hydrogen exchanger family-domain-containing protein [Podospora aff. communis PSN243]